MNNVIKNGLFKVYDSLYIIPKIIKTNFNQIIQKMKVRNSKMLKKQ